MLTISLNTHAAISDCTLTGIPALPSPTAITVNIPRDLAVGAAIPGSRILINWSINCKSTAITSAASWAVDLLPEASGTTAVTGLTNVYTKTTYPSGVGFRFLDGSNTALPFGVTGALWYSFKLGDAPIGQTSFQWSGAVELVKTTNAPASGSIKINFAAQAVTASGTQAWGNTSSANSTLTATWTIVNTAVTTCTVTNPTQTVTLPTVSATTASLNPRSAYTPFTISLKCSAGSTLYMTITDAGDPSNTYTVIKAIGTTLLYGIGLSYVDPASGNISNISLGSDSSAAGTKGQFKVGSTPDGTMNLKFLAAYAHYPGQAFPVGPFTAKATFTLSYQ